MELSNLLGYGLATVGTVAIALSPGVEKSFVEASNNHNSTPQTTNSQPSPRRLTVTVRVQEPEDLKLAEGDEVKAGDIIASRDREKQRLEAQRTQLALSLERLQAYQPTPPTPPQAVPLVKALPPVSYLEHEAAIEKAKAAIASVESEMEIKKQEISYLSELPNLDPIILAHEQAKLKQLKLKHTAAVKDYQLAMGKLQSAKDSRAYQEYQASLAAARRIEELNQARLNYQRQLAEYEQRLADREFKITQVKAKLNDIDNQIASLSVVKAPYAGTVRRVKWLGQSPDGSLTAEVTLIVRNREQGEFGIRNGGRIRKTLLRRTAKPHCLCLVWTVVRNALKS